MTMRLALAAAVVTGDGFTPQNFGGKLLAEILKEEPDQEIISGAAAFLHYPNGHRVLIQSARLEVGCESSVVGNLDRVSEILLKLLTLWPLVEPKGLGINYDFVAESPEPSRTDAVGSALLRLESVGKMLGARPSNFDLSVTGTIDDARITMRVRGPSKASNEPLVVGFNVHYEPVPSPADLLSKRGEWLNRTKAIAEQVHDAQ